MKTVLGTCYCWIAFCGAFCAITNTLSVSADEPIPISVWAYHNKPPYMIDVKLEQGQYFDFVRFLNSKTGQYHFSLKYLPRNRVRQLVAGDQFSGMILGVNPLWFDDQAEQEYLWTSAIFKDEDIFVSLQKTPFEYVDPTSYQGKSACLVLGNYYAGISDADDTLLLSLLHTSKEIAVFSMLNKKRCDFGVVSRSNYIYRLAHKDIVNHYYVSTHVHDRFDRRILLAKDQLPVFLFIQEALKDWQVIDDSH